MRNNIIYLKSDLDGKIVFFNFFFQKLFLYTTFNSGKRIFNFFHQDYVIDFIKYYNLVLKNENKIKNEFILILPSGENLFCNILLEKDNNFVNVYISVCKNLVKKNKKKFYVYLEKFLFLTRFKFTIGSLMPLFFTLFWAIYKHSSVSYGLFFIIFFAVFLLHSAANTFNDYFDWVSGRDKKNKDYVLLSTGGSRAIDFNIVSDKFMLLFSLFSLFIVFLISIYLFVLKGFLIFIIGFIALFSIYFYSAPPIHLASRKGLGELMHIICLGPLLTYGSIFVISENPNILDFAIGIPNGLLITGCLLINELPDSKFDSISKKKNLAVLLGYKYVTYIYFFLFLLSFIIILFLILFKFISYYFLLVLLILPYFLFSLKSFLNIISKNRYFISKSCAKSLYIYIFFNIIISLASFLSFLNP